MPHCSAALSPRNSARSWSASSTSASPQRRTRCYVRLRWPMFLWVSPPCSSAARARVSAEQQDALEAELIRALKGWKKKGGIVVSEAASVIAELIMLLLKHHRLLDA